MTDTHEQWDIVSSVGLTALGVAAARAVETNSPDPLVRDPYAEGLVRAADAPVPMPTHPVPDDDQRAQTWSYLRDRMAGRTRYFDEFFERVQQEGFEQAVVLASGLDTRAFRMSWPAGFHLFEIDQQAVLDFKERTLRDLGAEPGCSWHPVRVDLRDDWESALVDARFDRTRRTAWLAEGLLSYLPAAAQQQLMEIVDRLSAPGSAFSLNANSEHFPSEGRVHLALDSLGVNPRELMSDEQRPPAERTLGELGWTAETASVIEVGHHCDRPLEGYGDDTLQGSYFATARK